MYWICLGGNTGTADTQADLLTRIASEGLEVVRCHSNIISVSSSAQPAYN